MVAAIVFIMYMQEMNTSKQLPEQADLFVEQKHKHICISTLTGQLKLECLTTANVFKQRKIMS